MTQAFPQTTKRCAAGCLTQLADRRPCLHQCWLSETQRSAGQRCLVACWQT